MSEEQNASTIKDPIAEYVEQDDEGALCSFDDDETLGCFEEDCEPDESDDSQTISWEPQIAPAVKLAGESDIVKLYNRVGGLMEQLAAENDLDVAYALGVFKTECGPLLHSHRPGAAIIRFENHLLWKTWGKKNPALYDEHWKHQRVAPEPETPVKAWHGHQFRATVGGRWVESHPKRGSQTIEYISLEKARALAGDVIALRCISIGGPQLLVRNFAVCGFASELEMYGAMQGGEETHVRAFFEFIKNTTIKRKGRAPYTLIAALRAGDVDGFTYGYNGSGQVPLYSPKVARNSAEARSALGRAA